MALPPLLLLPALLALATAVPASPAAESAPNAGAPAAIGAPAAPAPAPRQRTLRIRAVGDVARQLGLPAPGYRLLANIGGHGHQEVPHLHVHIFGGKQLGAMLPR